MISIAFIFFVVWSEALLWTRLARGVIGVWSSGKEMTLEDAVSELRENVIVLEDRRGPVRKMRML